MVYLHVILRLYIKFACKSMALVALKVVGILGVEGKTKVYPWV